MKWHERLFNLMAGAKIKEDLRRAGASKDAIAGAITKTMPLPTFGGGERQPPAGKSESRDLQDAHPELVRRYLLLKADFERQTGKGLFETSTWRSKERQNELFQIGRRGVAGEKTVTQLDGLTRKSRHNVYPSEALDVCVDGDPGPGKHPVWESASYAILGPLAVVYGLVWGGNFKGFADYPHLELPAGSV